VAWEDYWLLVTSGTPLQKKKTKQYTNINGFCYFTVKNFSSLEAIDENFTCEKFLQLIFLELWYSLHYLPKSYIS